MKKLTNLTNMGTHTILSSIACTKGRFTHNPKSYFLVHTRSIHTISAIERTKVRTCHFTQVYMATLFGGEAHGFVLEVASSIKLDPTHNISPKNLFA